MSLNVHGNLELKIGMTEFIESINAFDIVFLSETWTNDSSEVDIEGFAKPICKHRKRKRTGKRDSGGLCCYFRKDIFSGAEGTLGLRGWADV